MRRPLQCNRLAAEINSYCVLRISYVEFGISPVGCANSVLHTWIVEFLF